ncbi:MAG: glycosyltransferase family 2 protein [Candidatus Nomurabacteria bacterium]|nr:glycosyltransferase family 2 protein [Candidatus Nomurabacteria bacterium]
MAKISIIIPTYNSSKFIRNTIQSVLEQTYTDWELLIIDDCSKDETEEIIKEYKKKEPKIKFYKTDNNSGGPALSKNIGIKNSNGSYIAFLDHDDEWHKEKLEKQIKLFENSKDKNLGIVSTFLDIKEKETIIKYSKNYRKDILKYLASGNFLMTSSCIMVKKDVFEKIGLFDKSLSVSDDLDMWIRIAKNNYNFDYVPEYLTTYIYHNKNASLINRENYTETKLLFKKHKEIYLKYNIKIVILNYILYLFPNSEKKIKKIILKIKKCI